MKRLISLILAVALLLSLAPAVFADGEEAGGVALAFGTIREIEQDVYDTTDKVKYYAIPVVVKNTTSEEITLNALQCIFNYDESGLAPANIQADEYSFIDPITFSSKPVSEWESKDGNAANGLITVIAATTKSNYYVRVKAGQERVLFELNLARVNDVENGDYNVTFADPYLNDDGKRMQNKIGYDDTDIQISYSQSEGNLDLTDEEKITITDGKAPVLASVAVDKDKVGYASGDVITLSAESTSGKNVTDFVTFTIKDYTGDGLAIDGNKLTVSAENPANVGIYTVVATPDGTNCKLAEGASAPEATFTIIPKKITNPKVAITGFAKGNDIHWDLKIEPKDTAGLISDGVNCYEGPKVTDKPTNSGKFKADMTYTFAITLDATENYELGEGTLTYTINGGEEMTTPIVEKNDFPTPYYQAIVTAATAGLDSPTLELDELTATYGDLLSSLEPKGTATFNSKPIDGRFAWSTEYDADTKVGDAGEKTFNVVFTPTDKEVYATVNGTVTVNVAQKEIEFKTSDYEWKSINPDDVYTVDSYGRMRFQYDGKEHGIEPSCNNEAIRDLVEFEYVTPSTTNKSINVTGATVKARVLLKNNNYKFDKESTIINDGDWSVDPIVIGYTGEYTYSVDVCYTTSSVDIPLSEFSLPENVLTDANNKYLMRTDAVVVDAGNVLADPPTSFDDTTRTLTLNLKNLTKTDANKTASVTLGLKVNNYETTNTGVAGIAGGEEKLFILKLNVKIIEKENAGLTITGIPESLVYGESAEWSYNVTKPGENGNISGSVTPAGILNNDPYKLTAIGVGEATVTITYSSDTTYAQEKFTITVTPKPLTAAVSHDPITYGDPTPTEGYTVTFNGLLTGDVLADTDYTVGTEYKQGDPVGKYAFTCVLNSETVKNYKLDTVNGELVVNKKELTDGDVTVTVLGETPVYDGSEKKPAVEVKYGETTLAAADYTVSYSNNVNAGVNTASVTVTSNDNSSYKFTATKNFTIAQAPISGAMIANIPSVTYNTRAHTPEVTVRFNGSKLTDADYTVSYSEDCINAGTVTVTVTGKGNFTGTASKTFTINKAGLTLNPCTISELCTETDLKTRTLPSDFFLAGETETGFSIKLTAVEGGDDIFAVAPAVVEGENKITFRLKNEVGAATFTVTVTPVSGNYNGGSYALTISTHDRTDVSGSISFPDGSAVYTGTGIKYENATISGYSGTLRYGYTPNASTGASLDASGLPLTVGTYTVAVTFNSDASFGYKTATFTITKATPTGTPGYTKLETSGKTLADAKLTVGTIRPAGTIAWDLPLTTVLEDGKAYAWTFTPNDTHNYAILTGTLVPYVDDGMDYIPGVIGGNTGSFNFHDVSRFDYFYDAVKWAAENGIASGTGRYTFSPNAVCTRAQTVTFLWRAAGSPLPRYRVCPFTDVQPSDYYYNAVLWAVEQGITTGLNANTFGPDVTVTRGQVATFLYRAASAAKPSTFNPFTDVKTTAYNYGAILWAYDNRITTGTSDTTFSPDAYCTRAQIVTFLYRYYQGR
ncbi:MAG: S-layer homology domain-containing protein [Oscillospiraceae bacterium]